METSRLFGTSVTPLPGFGDTASGLEDESIVNAKSLDSKALNKDDFLKLLMTQMQHQDPLNPLNNTEFLSQLSQFTQLEQIYNVNQNILDLNASQSSIRDCLLANLLGKTVKAEGSEIYLKDESGVNLTFDLMEWADKISIIIYDTEGRQIKTIEKSNQEGGLHNVHWDGTNNKAQKVKEGPYTFTITAHNGEESVWAIPYMAGQVSEIIFSPEEGPLVQLENQKIPISKIIQIMNKGQTSVEATT